MDFCCHPEASALHEARARSERTTSRTRRHDSGYILVTLLLFVTLIAISLVALAPVISQQIKRDREEELIHRGVQYSRAIQHYVKKNGSYPARLEDLEKSGNNIRYLRRRYKDPITGKDFKLLRLNEVQTNFTTGIQGGSPAANLAAGALAAGNPINGNSGFSNNGFSNNGFGNNNSGFGNNGGFGSGGFGGGGFGNNSGFGNNGGFGSSGGFGGSGFGNTGGFGGNSRGGFGGMGNSGQTGFSFGNGQSGTNTNAQGTDASQLGQTVTPAPGTQNSPNDSTSSNNQVFGGLPIVGVISTSKDTTIRVFNKKDKYYQWQFIYDPSMDRGGLITLPYTGMQTGGGRSLQPQQSQNNNGQNGGFGTPINNLGNQQGQGFGSSGFNPDGGPKAVPQPSPYPQMPPEQGDSGGPQ